MKGKQLGGSLLLLLAALIWGVCFVVQVVGLESLRPFTFNALRMLLGGLVLLPAALFRGRRRARAGQPRSEAKTRFLAGALCGAALWLATTLQQFGLVYTTAGKSAFVTTLYVVLVPVLGLALRRRAGVNLWIGVALAVCSLYFLCVSEALTVNRGDLITLAAALCFALHILIIDRFAPLVDGVALSCAQFFVAGTLSLVCALLTETATLQQVYNCRYMLLYAGVLSCGVAYTAQIIGQKHVDPTVASLLMCLESVFAVLAGWVFLGERLSGREWTGCALMLVAVVLAQLPERFFVRREKKGAPRSGLSA